MVPIVTLKLAEHNTREKSVRKDKEIVTVCGHHMQKHSLLGDCLAAASPLHPLSLSLAPKQVKLIHNHLCFLNGQIDITD